MKLFRTLLEDSFKQQLFALQQRLLDDLPSNTVVDLKSTVDNGSYAVVICKGREYNVKPSDLPDKIFLLTMNGKMWSGPYPYDGIKIAMLSDMSEGAYRALIIDNEWVARR